MRFPLFISKKYLTSKYASNYLSFFSVISIGGIALGVAILIMALSILEGFEKAVEEKIISFNSHIKITAFGNRNLEEDETAPEIIRETCGGDFVSLSPFIQKQAIIKSKKLSEGITVTGIDINNDNSNIRGYIKEGEYSFESKTGKSGIIIGRKLARKLHIKLGGKITLFTLFKDKIPSVENPPAIEQFVVNGIYESGMAEYDDLNVFASLSDLQRLFGLRNFISGYNVKLSKLDSLNQIAERLQIKLRYPHYVRTVYKTHQNIFTWLDLQKKPIPIVLGLIIIVAVFNIVGSLLIMALERTKSIGILKTLGAGNMQIITIFLIQGMFISIIGIVSGCALSYFLSYVQIHFGIFKLPGSIYFLSKAPIFINPDNYLAVALSAFALSIAASFIPSYYAAKTDPVKSIMFE